MESNTVVIRSDKCSSGLLSISSPQSQQADRKHLDPIQEPYNTTAIEDVEMDDDDNEDDLPVWQFARRHGLATPFDYVDPRAQVTNLLTLHHVDERDTNELVPMSKEALSALQGMELEKLDINEAAAQMLYCVMKGCEEDHPFKLQEGIKNGKLCGKTICGMEKLPQPLLRTDDEVDKVRVQRLSKVSIRRHGMKRLQLDIDADEGFEWSNSMLELPQKTMEELGKERLEVPMGVLHIMQSFMVDDCTDDSRVFLLDEAEGSRKVRMGSYFCVESMAKVRQRIKPSPIIPPLTPHPSSSPNLSSEIDINTNPWSEITDPDMHNLEAIEADMAKQDDFPIPTSDSDATKLSGTDSIKQLGRIYPPLAWMLHSSMSDPEPVAPLDCKLEIPLMADQGTSHNTHFNMNILRTQLENDNFSQMSWPGQASGGLADAMEIMRPFAEQAHFSLQQEQLKELDATLRVDVPSLAYPDRLAPWDEYGRSYARDVPFQDELTAQKRLLPRLKNDELQDMDKWPGASQLEIHILWKPFSDNVAKHILDEKIDQGNHFQVILDYKTLEDAVISDLEAWKPEGLRIFDDVLDEEQLESAVAIAWEDSVEEVIRKSNSKMVDEFASAGKACLSRNMPQFVNDLEQRTSMLDNVLRSDENKGGGAVSTAGYLSKFLALNGIREPIIQMDHSQSTKTTDPRLAGKQRHQINGINHPSGLQGETVDPLELPALPTELPKQSFIVSTELIKSRRSLYRHIERLCPKAEFFERCFTSLLSSNLGHGAMSQRQEASLYHPEVEVDIILSPSTGLVLTTLQMIQQISLPGAGVQRIPSHDSIRQLSVRYERLVILVSQSAAHDRPSGFPGQQPPSGTASIGVAPPPMTSYDVIALARLNVLTASLPADTIVQLIAGGERELAGWAAFYMSNTLDSGDVAIAMEESFWEQALRRAGLNCFAACTVLSILGRGEYGGTGEDPSFGLPAFIQMRPEDRLNMFRGLFGGDNILKRVNTCLEKSWMSASRGFRKG